MRLNLGCGLVNNDTEIGVDREKMRGVKVIADVTSLPFSNDSADFVRLDHVLEHLPYRKAPVVLFEAWRVLQEGGQIRVAVPDFLEMCRTYANTVSMEDKVLLIRWMYGTQVHPGEYHHGGWDSITLKNLLEACGFRNVTVSPDSSREEASDLNIVAVAIK